SPRRCPSCGTRRARRSCATTWTDAGSRRRGLGRAEPGAPRSGRLSDHPPVPQPVADHGPQPADGERGNRPAAGDEGERAGAHAGLHSGVMTSSAGGAVARTVRTGAVAALARGCGPVAGRLLARRRLHRALAMTVAMAAGPAAGRLLRDLAALVPALGGRVLGGLGDPLAVLVRRRRLNLLAPV